MKTVMKKLMSLLLVAVLLVSAVPFQASAAGYGITVYVTVTNNTAKNTSFTAQALDDNALDLATWKATADSMVTDSTFDGWYWSDGASVSGSEIIGENWTIEARYTENTHDVCGAPVSLCECSRIAQTEPKFCNGCSSTSLPHAEDCTLKYACCAADKTGDHETDCANYCDQSSSCDAPDGAHKTTCNSLPCSTSGCTLGNGHTVDHIIACEHCTGTSDSHESTCPTQKCTTSGCENNNHGTTEPHSFETQCEGCKAIFNKNDAHCTVCHEAHTVSNCRYCATCYTNTNGKDKIETHKAGDHCGYCSGVGGKHAADCFTLATKYDLNVYVRRKVGEYVKDTVLLNTYTVEKDTPIVKFVLSKEAELQGLIDSKLGADHYWTSHIYNFEGTELNATDTILSANGERNVYINAYGKESEILIYVHLNGSATTDRIAALHGYDTRVDKDVSYNAVLARVQEFYGTGISMTMYSATGWADKLAGNTNTSAGSTVSLNTSGVTKIHVSISGGTTNKYVADSSNPKTGDEIFMAVTTLAVSASALALCFYFKKKRSVK